MTSGSSSGIIGMSGGAYVTDWSPTHDPAAGVPPHPLHRSSRKTESASSLHLQQQQHQQQQQQQQHQQLQHQRSAGSGGGGLNSNRSHHFITESDLKRDFDFYQA